MTRTSVQVIGAGWGRTGTSSLKKALEILGFGPCYHMTEVIKNNDAVKWTKFIDNPTNKALLHMLLGGNGYVSTCDYPSSAFWREQLELYPEAKVVFTTRDPKKWYKSCCDTVFQVQPNRPGTSLAIKAAMAAGIPCSGIDKMLGKLIGDKFLHGDWSEEYVIEAYNAHCEDVLNHCPADKLLVLEVKEGWAPLCEFLEVAIPDVPFPHVNETAEFQKIITLLTDKGSRILVWCGFGLVLVVFVLGAALWGALLLVQDVMSVINRIVHAILSVW